MKEILPFYLYGTARYGEPLHWMIEHVAVKISSCKAPNTQLMVPDYDEANPAFPYLVQHGGIPTETWGELALLRRSHALSEFVQMEINAGYSLEAIRIEHTIPNLPSFALAFVWKADTDWLVPLGGPSWLLRHTEFAR